MGAVSIRCGRLCVFGCASRRVYHAVVSGAGEGEVVDGRVDLRPLLTHTFRLEQWRDAFLAIANQRESGAVKVAIDLR